MGTMLGIKDETRDVDFILEEGDTTSFKTISERICGTDVDVFGRCSAYSIRIPDDYTSKSNLIAKFDMLAVYAMDVIVTKMARGEDRDFEDSKNCLKFGNYGEYDIRNRMSDYEHDSKMAENVGKLVGRYT